MMQTQKPTGRAASIPGGLAIGALISLTVTILMAMILAKLIQSQTIAQEQVGYGVMALLFTSSFLGAAAAQGKVKHRRLLVCMLTGAVYFLILMSITALFFGGQYSAVGVTALLVMGAAGCAALLCANPGKGSGRSRKKHRKRFS